jgi:UDP-glucuronate 4-epimerase
LLDFVDAIEEELSIKAKRNYMPIQKGDVPATWADATLLFNLTGFKPNTDIKHGISKFIEWFRDYYKV